MSSWPPPARGSRRATCSSEEVEIGVGGPGDQEDSSEFGWVRRWKAHRHLSTRSNGTHQSLGCCSAPQQNTVLSKHAQAPTPCTPARRYEKARKLKDSIADIRAEYTRNWDARDRRERQVPSAGVEGLERPGSLQERPCCGGPAL